MGDERNQLVPGSSGAEVTKTNEMHRLFSTISLCLRSFLESVEQRNIVNSSTTTSINDFLLRSFVEKTFLFSLRRFSSILFLLVSSDILQPISSNSNDYQSHASRIQRVGLHQYLFEHTNTLLVGSFDL